VYLYTNSYRKEESDKSLADWYMLAYIELEFVKFGTWEVQSVVWCEPRAALRGSRTGSKRTLLSIEINQSLLNSIARTPTPVIE
jgi:hypothetical protein